MALVAVVILSFYRLDEAALGEMRKAGKTAA